MKLFVGIEEGDVAGWDHIVALAHVGDIFGGSDGRHDALMIMALERVLNTPKVRR